MATFSACSFERSIIRIIHLLQPREEIRSQDEFQEQFHAEQPGNLFLVEFQCSSQPGWRQMALKKDSVEAFLESYWKFLAGIPASRLPSQGTCYRFQWLNKKQKSKKKSLTETKHSRHSRNTTLPFSCSSLNKTEKRHYPEKHKTNLTGPR